MSSKKKTPATLSTSPQTLKIGSRVRCTDDGVEGRIVWANGVSVNADYRVALTCLSDTQLLG